MVTTVAMTSAYILQPTLVFRLRSMTSEAKALLNRALDILERHADRGDPDDLPLIEGGLALLAQVENGDVRGVAESVHSLRHRIRINRVDGSPLIQAVRPRGERWMEEHMIRLGVRPGTPPLETDQLATDFAELEGKLLASKDPSLQEIAQIVHVQDQPERWLDRTEMEEMDDCEARMIYQVLLNLSSQITDARARNVRLKELEIKTQVALQAAEEAVKDSTTRITQSQKDGDESVKAGIAYLEKTQEETVTYLQNEIRDLRKEVRDLKAKMNELEAQVQAMATELKAAIERLRAAEAQNAANAAACSSGGDGGGCSIM